MRFMYLTLALFAVPLTMASAGDTAVKKDLKALEGKWKVVALVEDGKELPKVPAITISFRANGTAVAQTPEGETQATWKIDPSKKPKTLDIVHGEGVYKDKKQFAIYELEKGKLVINATRPGGEEADRPDGFTKGRLLVFERVKDDKKP